MIIPKNIRTDYRGWKFWDKVPLITRDKMFKAYLDGKFDNIDVDVNVDVDVDTADIKETITETINENLENLGLDNKFCKVHQHIEEAKDHLCCDICHAKKDIKKHIDDKLDPINFEEQFSNLNEQAQTIIEKLNSLQQ